MSAIDALYIFDEHKYVSSSLTSVMHKIVT